MLDHWEDRSEPDGPAAATAEAPSPLLRVAARLCSAPIAVLHGSHADAAWSDKSIGPQRLARLHAICNVLQTPTTVVDTATDRRTASCSAVAAAPGIRFVSGISAGRGTLWVMDLRPRPGWGPDEAAALADLADLARRQPSADPWLDQIAAACNQAGSVERALGGLLASLCERVGASSGLVGRLNAPGPLLEPVASYGDDPSLEYPLRDEVERVAAAVMADALHREPGLVVLPLHLVDERFGLVLRFTPLRREPSEGDLRAVLRVVRPLLYRKAAERRMSLLGTALDRANDAVLITDAGPLGPLGPRIIYANAAFCRTSLYERAEVLGRPLGMLNGSGTDPAAAGRLRLAMRNWQAARTELLQYRKDGGAFWAELDLTPIADDDGVPTYWVSIARDVTERRRHEASFRMLFQDNPLPVVVVDRENLAFLEVNGAAVAQYGWSRDEFLQRSLTDLDPDERQDLAEAMARGGLGASVSLTHVRDDGSTLDVQAFLHGTEYDGRPATLAVLWDVTDLEQARRDMNHANDLLRDRTRQLHARTEELAEAQRLARLGTWRLRADPDDPAWTAATPALLRVSGEVAGTPRPVLHTEDADLVRAALAATAQPGGKSRGFEYRLQVNPEQVRHMRAEVRAVSDGAGGVAELFGTVQDISKRKQAEQALLRNESLRALGQLTGGVAHDFNNLLTVVILNLEEARDTLPERHPLQEVLRPALYASIRGSELTAQLLSYARRATLRPERVRPDAFFAALRPLLARVLGGRHELEVRLRHDGCSAMVDPAQLDSAVMNLVLNARDAMPAGGTITVETRITQLADGVGFADDVAPGDYMVITVADEGEGMPPDVMGRMFEPFFTTKPAGKGNGMGLAMVYGFARQSGGHVAVESAPGQGTSVRLYLPVAPDEASETERPNVPAWDADGLRALLVDDQVDVRHSVARTLRQLGFRVTEVASGDAALAVLPEKFDLLLSDVVLPGGLDGVALAKVVRARWPQTRVLLASGFTEHALERDAGDILMKPFKRQHLQRILAEMFPSGRTDRPAQPR